MVGTSTGELWWCDTATDDAPRPLPAVQSAPCTALAATSRGLLAAFQGGWLHGFESDGDPPPGLAPLKKTVQCCIQGAAAAQVGVVRCSVSALLGVPLCQPL